MLNDSLQDGLLSGLFRCWTQDVHDLMTFPNENFQEAKLRYDFRGESSVLPSFASRSHFHNHLG